jgi:hypothetical protein
MNALKWLVLLVVGSFIAVMSVWPAHANGAPVKIFLNYLPEISNYGSTTASGVAMVSIGEAWVDLQIEGLPPLQGLIYEAWLVTGDNEQMISLGKFNSDEDGKVDYSAEFEDIPVLDYRFLVVSVETDPDPQPESADNRRSVAGVFPNAHLEVVSGTATPTLAPGITATPGAPASLPVTGNVASPTPVVLWLGAGLLLLVMGRVIYRQANRQKRL